jgi:hypothetical protein
VGNPTGGLTAFKTLGSLPVVEIDPISTGTFPVGAFAIAAELIDRMEAMVEISFEHDGPPGSVDVPGDFFLVDLAPRAHRPNQAKGRSEGAAKMIPRVPPDRFAASNNCFVLLEPPAGIEPATY